MKSAIEIVGAGPAGLAAAITLAAAGQDVIVHEAHGNVGARFWRDLQGLENWTTEQDVLDSLDGLGLTTSFAKQPCSEGKVYDAWDHAYRVQSRTPVFYLVERGPGPDSLDTTLLNQALELGVEVRFNSRVDQLEGKGILAVGPRAADAIAVGYHFDTDMENGFWVICDDELAPKGYAYLLVLNSKGTVKTCMFSGFKQQQRYVERTVAAFQRLVGLEMRNPRPHGGAGNFRIPVSATSGRHPVVGEQTGFQDTLWGFGMRIAMTSGVLAARSLLEETDYNALWQREIGPMLKTSLVNRAIYSRMGNRGYRWFLRVAASRPDIRIFLRHQYQPSLIKTLLMPWARLRYQSQRQDESCDHIDCGCVWCRHSDHEGSGEFADCNARDVPGGGHA